MPLVPFILIYVYLIPALFGVLVFDLFLLIVGAVGIVINSAYLVFVGNVYNEKALILATNIADWIVVKILPAMILGYIIWNTLQFLIKN